MKEKPPLRGRTRRILRELAKLYPDAHCALHHANALQLLVATILSAQCTDVRVNIVTPALFKHYPDAAAFAAADISGAGKAHPVNWLLPQQGAKHHRLLPSRS